MRQGAWYIAGVLVLAVAPAQLPLQAQPAQTPTTAAPLAEGAQDDVRQLSVVVRDPNAPQDKRDEAARRLALRNGEEARRALRGALLDFGNRGGQLAAARALSHLPQSDPEWITPLAALLGHDRLLTEAGAEALASFKGNAEILRRLKMFATNRAEREPSRVAVIRAIGKLVDKQAADELMSLLTKPDESKAIRDAAADALVEMTGLQENDRDVQRWRQWWQANRGKTDGEWRNDLLHSRAARFDQLQVRHSKLINGVKILLKEQYRLTEDVQKKDLLLRYLNHPEPEIRVVGAEIIHEDRRDSRPIPPEALAKLHDLVADSSTEVRFATARALEAINDPAALDALLGQLARETNPDVSVALVAAVWPIPDPELRAVPLLTELLNHSSYRVAEAAAMALGRLGPRIAEKDPAAAASLAAILRDLVERTANDLGAMALREAAVEAMVPLKASDEHPFLARWAGDTRGETQRVRRAAVEALGNLGVEQAADTIAEVMRRDPDAPVRLAAVRALGVVGNFENFEHAEALWNQLQNEPDVAVKSAIWRVLESMFPGAPTERLSQWADRLRDNPERQLVVLTALAEQLKETDDLDALSATHENIGQTRMRLRQTADEPEVALNHAKEAAEYFRQALDYKRQHGAQEFATRGLVEQLMDALLASKRYSDAAQFAARAIKDSAENHQTMGSKIWHEVERLREGGDVAGAMTLIRETKSMDPALDTYYAEEIAKIEGDIRRQFDMEKLKPSGTLILPHSASLDLD